MRQHNGHETDSTAVQEAAQDMKQAVQLDRRLRSGHEAAQRKAANDVAAKHIAYAALRVVYAACTSVMGTCSPGSSVPCRVLTHHSHHSLFTGNLHEVITAACVHKLGELAKCTQP